MIHLAAFALLAQPVSFSGGKSLDLCKAIHQATKQPVLMVDLGGRELKPFTFDTADLNEFARQTKAATGFSYVPGQDFVFSSGTLPRNLFGTPPLFGAEPVWFAKSFSGFKVENGLYSLETKPGEALTGVEIASLTFSKPVKVHWIAEHMPLVGHVTGVSELEFLRLVGKAMALRIVNKQNQFELILDANEFRNRAIATIKTVATPQVIAKLNKRDVAKLAHLEMALRVATQDQLNTAFATQGGLVKIPLSNAEKQKLYKDMANWNEQRDRGGRDPRIPSPSSGQKPDQEVQINEISTGRGRSRNYAAIRDSMNFNAPVYLILTGKFDTSIEGSINGPDGSPRPIRF